MSWTTNPTDTAPDDRVLSRRARLVLAIGGGATVVAVAAAFLFAPDSSESLAQRVAAYNEIHGQSFAVPPTVESADILRADYDSTPGIETYRQGGTNQDWAHLVLLFAEWPQTDDSVTVILRWMRQENYEDSWWLRNNPLNNGWGADGGHFLGGNPDLVDAAEDVADALTSYPGYREIAAAFERGAPAAEIERAIWASPWATGHYNNGTHWHYHDARIVTAPPSAWG